MSSSYLLTQPVNINYRARVFLRFYISVFGDKKLFYNFAPLKQWRGSSAG